MLVSPRVRPHRAQMIVFARGERVGEEEQSEYHTHRNSALTVEAIRSARHLAR